jgi:beta-phosphoglucomutase-like phosphatase (HAD superfamily)
MKAIIFDVDGVLFDSVDEAGDFSWTKSIQADLGITSKHLKKIFSGDWENVIRGKLDTKEYVKRVFKDYPELLLSPDQFISYWLAHDSQINNKILEMTKTIKIPVYLGTNQAYLYT